MKALTERLEFLRLSILDDKTGITDPAARENALDMWLEANAIADMLPEVTITMPTPPPGQRRVPSRIIHLADAKVHEGGRKG